MEECDVHRILAVIFMVAPLLAGCGKAEEPLIPELKGRWSAPNAARLRQVLAAEGIPTLQPATATAAGDCRNE